MDQNYLIWRKNLLNSRPFDLTPTETRKEFARVESMLNAISADCSYEAYRNIIWALESLNWLLAYELQYNWSITAPHRFDQNTLNNLIRSYRPGHFSLGTIIKYAKDAGWSEGGWEEQNAKRTASKAEIIDDGWLKATSSSNDSKKTLGSEMNTEILLPINNDSHYSLLKIKELQALPPTEYHIKNILPKTGISAVYGPSMSGKSFFIIDLLSHLALGKEWYGNKVNACHVTYLALEGAGGICNRMTAWERKHGLNLPDSFRVITQQFHLMDAQNVSKLASSINSSHQNGGIVVIDTLNRSSPNADENISKDMGVILNNTQLLQMQTDCHILLVHHTGKDTSKGLRGHSSLLAALDAAIEIKTSQSGRVWTLLKSKDGKDGIAHPFRLEVIQLGVDQDGEEVSSCVATPDLNLATFQKSTQPKGPHQKIALNTLKNLLSSKGRKSFPLNELIKEIGGNLAVDQKRKNERARAAINGLIGLDLIALKEGDVFLS